jgi:hypothetical protein
MCSCDCEAPDWDDESGEQLFESEIVVVAESLVKPIKCCECGTAISIGERYRHIRGCWDGDWATYKMCLGCSDLSDRFTSEPDNCHCLGGLYEELINSEILFTLKDDGRTIRDESGSPTWLTETNWLRVVNQDPLKCEVNV